MSVSRLGDDPYLYDLMAELEAVPAEPTTPTVGSVEMKRRGFLKVAGSAGGGLVIGLCLGPTHTLAADVSGGPPRFDNKSAGVDFAPNAYVRIAPDGLIHIVSKGPEIGQGIKTAFPMIVAEELDADWALVRVEQAPIDAQTYGRQSAGGSRSIPAAWDELRKAGALARAMLITAAARKWQVPAQECTTDTGTVRHLASGRRAGYGELAELAATLPVPDEATLKLKTAEQYRLLGKRVGGVDNHALVTGQPLFGIDQQLPGMLYATYAKCPAPGGRVRAANLDEVRAQPGVRDVFVLQGNGLVTEVMSGVAIIAESTWAAFQAKRILKVDWDETDAARDSWSAALRDAQVMAGKAGAEKIREQGDVDSVFSRYDENSDGGKTLEAFYSYPFVSHAPLEPQNCTAWHHDDMVELWAPTQTPQRAKRGVAHTLGLDERRVTLHQTRAGGGFGRRLINDYACEAALIASRVAAPVKLQWSREDDMGHDFYRVAGFHSLKASVDSAGKLAAWQDHFVTFSADGEKPVPGGNISAEEFPGPLVENYRLSQSMLGLVTPCGPWRAPRSNGIAFAVQCFINELAGAGGRDHLEFLLELMGSPRWLEPGNGRALHTGRAAQVIQLAADKAGWGRPLPAGRGLGLGFHFSHAGHFAEVVEVSVDANKKLSVHQVTVAGDVGPIVNLSGAENQCTGAVLDGLSTALGLGITLENGRVQQSNFDQYPLMRIDAAPQVAVHFIDSEFRPSGLGEPALPPLAPALCNAIFAASGERVHSLPLSQAGYCV